VKVEIEFANPDHALSVVEGLRSISYVDTARQIEAQLPKPKPPEPTGLGAVVEDAGGGRWVRRQGMWCSFNDYADLDVVRVLTEGVTE
jgi:hypothetical protein